MRIFLLSMGILLSSVGYPQDRKDMGSHASHGTLNVGQGDSCLTLIRGLEAAFEVRSPLIGAIGTIDVDAFVPGMNPPFRQHWCAVLKRRSYYANVCCEVFFPFINGCVEDTSNALKKIEQYYDLTTSVPWIRKLIQSDTSISVTIKYVGGISLSKRAQASFVTSLAKHSWRGEELIQELLPQLDQVAFFDLNEEMGKYSRWLVLPSHESILWHYKGYGVLDFDLGPFQETDCSGHHAVFVRLSPEGKIMGAP